MQTGNNTFRKRCKRYDISGHAHHLTFSCFQNRSFLADVQAARWFIDALGKARDRQPFDLWGFVVMPEHVHILLLPGGQTTVSSILSSVKTPVARRAKAWAGRMDHGLLHDMADAAPDGSITYRFWQRGGGYDRNTISAEDAHEKLRYIHENPVRRGLVEEPEEWLWSSTRAWLEGTDEPIRIDRHSLPVTAT